MIYKRLVKSASCVIAIESSTGLWICSFLQLVTVYPKKYAHGFVVLCFVVVMQSFIVNSHEVFIHIHQGCFAGTRAIVRLPQCQGSKPDGYGKISQCTTTTKHSKAKTVCIFLGIYCNTLAHSGWPECKRCPSTVNNSCYKHSVNYNDEITGRWPGLSLWCNRITCQTSWL